MYDGVGIRPCQRDSGGAVHPGDDLGIGTAGDCDAGDCVFGKSLWDSEACVEAGDAHGSDGRVFVGNGILTEENSGGVILPLFCIEIFVKRFLYQSTNYQQYWWNKRDIVSNKKKQLDGKSIM